MYCTDKDKTRATRSQSRELFLQQLFNDISVDQLPSLSDTLSPLSNQQNTEQNAFSHEWDMSEVFLHPTSTSTAQQHAQLSEMNLFDAANANSKRTRHVLILRFRPSQCPLHHHVHSFATTSCCNFRAWIQSSCRRLEVSIQPRQCDANYGATRRTIKSLRECIFLNKLTLSIHHHLHHSHPPPHWFRLELI